MQRHYTNTHGVSLALAVFLLYDSYDYDDRENAISATTLIKPMRQIVLSRQNKELMKTVDITDLVASRMGSAIHTGCEEAWTSRTNIANALKALGASDQAIESVIINPTSVKPGQIPVYVEQRAERKVLNFYVTGKYDLVLNGKLQDYKSTSVWSYIYDSNAENYTKQGSIYKFLNPDKITEDVIGINYIFTDWSAVKARADKNYPQLRVLTKDYPLWSPEETAHWIKCQLEEIERLADAPQEALPECTEKELWASDPVFKYYKNPDKMSKSTKNFTTMNEAISRKSADGDVGTIVSIPGQVKACGYCPVVSVCNQAEKMLVSGRLVL